MGYKLNLRSPEEEVLQSLNKSLNRWLLTFVLCVVAWSLPCTWWSAETVRQQCSPKIKSRLCGTTSFIKEACLPGTWLVMLIPSRARFLRLNLRRWPTFAMVSERSWRWIIESWSSSDRSTLVLWIPWLSPRHLLIIRFKKRSRRKLEWARALNLRIGQMCSPQ